MSASGNGRCCLVARNGNDGVPAGLDGEDLAVLGEQRERRVTAGAVRNGAGGAGVDVAVLLGDLGTCREHDVDAARTDVGKARAEVGHQALQVEAVPDALSDRGARLFLLRLVLHVQLSLGSVSVERDGFLSLRGVPPASMRRWRSSWHR